MSTYQVTITKTGNPHSTLTISAADALTAISQAEKQAGEKTVMVSQGTNGSTKNYQWSGLEFTARRIN